MKYIRVEWPNIQEYMNHPDWKEGHYYDSHRDSWFIPEDWEDWEKDPESGGDIGDLEDALG